MTQLLALLISLVIELPVVLIILAMIRQLSSIKDIYNALILACLATLITHPLAWEINQILMPYLGFSLRVGLIEIAVVIAEGVLYTFFLNLGWRIGLLLSLIANATSFLGGLLINNLLR